MAVAVITETLPEEERRQHLPILGDAIDLGKTVWNEATEVSGQLLDMTVGLGGLAVEQVAGTTERFLDRSRRKASDFISFVRLAFISIDELR